MKYPTESSELGISRKTGVSQKVVFGGLGVLVLFFAFSGLMNRGYESKTISFANVSRSSRGTSFGPKRLFLRKGQTFAAKYEAQIERGGLYIRLSKFSAPFNTPATGQVRLTHSGSGRLDISIPETGMYHLSIQGSPDADGYRLSYNVSWKAE